MQLVGYLGSHLQASQGWADQFRKAVLCLQEVSVTACVSCEWPEIRLTGGAVAEPESVTPQRILDVVASAAQFFGEHLAARPALRLTVLTDATSETEEGTFSPLLVAEANRYAFPRLGTSGHPVLIGRMVALNWWGAGVQVEGANGNQLAIAMAFACALSWARQQYSSAYFEPLLGRYRELADTRAAKWVHFRIGLPIYTWIQDDDRRWSILAEILHAGWEVWQPQHLFVGSLAKSGLELRRILAEAPPDLADYSN